jgi:glycosyltransferase involved in cell wall biosynthesis
MNITFASTNAAWGGSEELWGRTALRMAGSGHRVSASVSAWPWPHPVLTELERAGVILDRRLFRPLSLWRRGWSKLRRISAEADRERIARRWLAGREPSLVCISLGLATDGAEWMGRCRELGIPYVVIAQLVSPLDWPNDRLALVLAKGYRAARRCFFVSERCRIQFQDQIGENLSNAQIVRNPFGVRHGAGLPWPDAAGGWRLACVARLDPSFKGQDLLFAVLSKPKWKERNCRISLYGGGLAEAGLQRLRVRLGLEDLIEFKGQVADIERIWKEHHALILPSRTEGMPLALVEAMLCSRPAVVTDVGGTTELVRHNFNGFVAAGADFSCLDQALDLAWAERTRWQEMGLRAREAAAAFAPPNPVEVFCRTLMELQQP